MARPARAFARLARCPGGGGLLYVGVDLAWGLGGLTGPAAVDDKGHLVDVARMRTDAEILNWPVFRRLRRIHGYIRTSEWCAARDLNPQPAD